MGRIEKLLKVSDWAPPAPPVKVAAPQAGRPPQPPPAQCAVCGDEYPWVWDDDLPLPGDMVISYKPEPGWNEIAGEWWGEEFHCSNACYRAGKEWTNRS